MPDTVMNAESALSLHLLHHHIQSDECTSATYSCTAVYQQWVFKGGRAEFTHITNETDERHGIFWRAMIWLGSVVKLSHFQRFLSLFQELYKEV